ALLPRFMIHDDLREGTLAILDLDQAPQRAELFVAHPRDRGSSRKVAALVAHLREAYGNPPYWEEKA
ncbi:MAG: LysR substrate-binding domain-containing protein, partial [Microvirga sp.]